MKLTKPDDMKIVASFQVTCCNLGNVFPHQHEALRCLLNHIKACHQDLDEKLTKRARRLAMGRNGCGYWDPGKGDDGDWPKASQDFRDAWREDALKELLQIF